MATSAIATSAIATSAMQRALINACLSGFQSILHNIISPLDTSVHQDGGSRLVHGTKENSSIYSVPDCGFVDRVWSHRVDSSLSSTSHQLSHCVALLSRLFLWCSGYHVRLTRARSPVRSRAETVLFFFSQLYSFLCLFFFFVFVFFFFVVPKMMAHITHSSKIHFYSYLAPPPTPTFPSSQ